GRARLSDDLAGRRHHLGPYGFADVDVVRPGLLRRGDDPPVDAALRPGALRHGAARLAAPVGPDDRRRDADQQDGSGPAQGLRPDAGPALRHLDGVVRQRRRLLSLQLQRRARLRPRGAGGRLCPGLPADRRGPAVRHPATAEEDPPHGDHRTMSELVRVAERESALTPLGTEMVAALGVEAVVAYGELTLIAPREKIVEVMTALRDQFGFQQCMHVCGSDYPDRAERFEVVYHLLSLTRAARVRVKVSTDEVQPVPSVTSVYPSAGWFEREAFDMYGMIFSDHPDMRRILTDYGFQGHPLRKDFPMTGYVEVRYDEEQKRIVYEPVKLTQEFRNFDFLSPWEGADYPTVLPGDEKAGAQ